MRLMYQSISLSKFLALLAAPRAVPGGGSASALAGALGAALGKMLTVINAKKKPRGSPQVKKLIDYARYFGQSYYRLLMLTGRDAQAYERVRRNLKTKYFQSALCNATQIPYQVMQEIVHDLTRFNQLSNLISPRMISDLGTAVILCKAGLEGADLNVRINLGGLMNRRRVLQMEKSRKVLMRKGTVLYKRIIEQVENKLNNKS